MCNVPNWVALFAIMSVFIPLGALVTELMIRRASRRVRPEITDNDVRRTTLRICQHLSTDSERDRAMVRGFIINMVRDAAAREERK